MNTNTNRIKQWQEQEALSRFQLIAPLLQEDLDDAKRLQLRKQIAQDNDISVRSIYRYEKAYREGQFAGLKPATREKRRSQKLPENFDLLLEQAIQLRKEVPERSVAQIICILELEGYAAPGVLKRSTLERHLYRAGYGREQMQMYHSVCSENGECLEDGRTTIFLSTCGENEAEVPKELVDFLKYVKNPGELPETEKRDSYEASVERQVQRIKRDREMEAQYMMLEEMLKDEREAGRKEGYEAGKNEGLKIGRLEGEERTMELVNVLMSQGRFEDLKRCLEDRAFREELLEQLGIKGKEKYHESI